jgi:membrane fusion protein, heavy metal efflux system
MKRNNKTAIAVVTIVLLGALLAAAILLKGSKEEEHVEAAAHAADIVALTAQQIDAAGIVTAKAGAATIATVLRFPGEIKLNEDRTAHVVPRVAGVAESVSADLGQSVRKGQILAVISSPELAELRSTALAANQRLDLARLTLEREKKLWEGKISAEQDYLQARQSWHEAKIAAQTAGAKLAALGANGTDGALNRYVLRAPLDGTVVQKHVAPGEALKEDANVFMLSDLSTVWAEVVIAAQDLEAVRPGTPVTVTSSASATTAQGKVSYVSALLGADTRTATARVVLPNPQRAWRPGLFVNVTMARGERQVPVAVAADAVRSVDGKSVVYVRVPQGFRAQPVTVGGTDGRQVEVVAGLAPGTVYATAGSFVLKAEQGKADAGHDD